MCHSPFHQELTPQCIGNGWPSFLTKYADIASVRAEQAKWGHIDIQIQGIGDEYPTGVSILWGLMEQLDLERISRLWDVDFHSAEGWSKQQLQPRAASWTYSDEKGHSAWCGDDATLPVCGPNYCNVW